MSILSFYEVKIGHIATNYNGDNFEVHDKGTWKAMTVKYPGLYGPEDLDDEYDGNTKVIVEKHTPTPLEGFEYTVWVYGDEGATVESFIPEKSDKLIVYAMCDNAGEFEDLMVLANNEVIEDGIIDNTLRDSTGRDRSNLQICRHIDHIGQESEFWYMTKIIITGTNLKTINNIP